MTSIRRFLSMPGADRSLLGCALATNIRARIAIHFLSIEQLRKWATKPASTTRDVDVARLVWAGRAAARRLPGATCLSSALALQHLLARNGHGSELHIGVTGNTGRFAAHAWLEREGVILIGEQDQGHYRRLTGWKVEEAVGGVHVTPKTPA